MNLSNAKLIVRRMDPEKCLLSWTLPPRFKADHTVQANMGKGKEQCEGVAEGEGDGHAGPEDGSREDEEGSRDIDKVKVWQPYH